MWGAHFASSGLKATDRWMLAASVAILSPVERLSAFLKSLPANERYLLDNNQWTNLFATSDTSCLLKTAASAVARDYLNETNLILSKKLIKSATIKVTWSAG